MTTKEHEGGPEIATEQKPRTVAIVACGPTAWDWHQAQATYERQIPPVDVVWSLNKALRTVKCGLGFVMDDLVGECRRSPEYHHDLRQLTIPILTSTVDQPVRDLLPKVDLWEYPLSAVLHYVGIRILKARGATRSEIERNPGRVHDVAMQAGNYLHNSVPYMLAYALLQDMHGIQLWGADYTFPGTDAREDDRANAEYWIGLLRAFGVEIRTSGRSTLLNSRQPQHFYGFGARQPVIGPPDQDLLLQLTDKADHCMTRRQ
jgi:hypothetical protein